MILLGGLGALVTDNAYHTARWKYFRNRFKPNEEPLSEEQREQARRMLQQLFSKMDLESLRAFTTEGDFSALNIPTFSKDLAIDLDQLGQLIEELKWPSAENEMFKGQRKPIDVRLAVEKLMAAMEENSLSRLPRPLLSELADKEMAAREKSGKGGEFYRIVSNGGRSTRMVAISRERQSALEANFRAAPPKKEQLNETERGFLESGELTLEEIGELRALRSATGILGSDTGIRDDLPGTPWGNARANTGGDFQQTCGDKTLTYIELVTRLRGQGLLKSFVDGGKARRDFPTITGGHIALSLTSRRTGKKYVLDGWHEAGSEAAHLVTLDDWHAGNDRADVVGLK